MPDRRQEDRRRRISRWKDDPTVRRFRFVTWGVLIALVAYMVFTRSTDAAMFGTLVGALIVYGGFEAGFLLPARKEGGEPDDPE